MYNNKTYQNKSTRGQRTIGTSKWDYTSRDRLGWIYGLCDASIVQTWDSTKQKPYERHWELRRNCKILKSDKCTLDACSKSLLWFQKISITLTNLIIT